MSKVFVTGIGMISAIGNTLGENHAALQKGHCGIRKTNNLQSRHTAVSPFAEISIDNQTLKEKWKVRGEGVTRTMLLALHASQEAIRDAQLSQSQLLSFDTALVNATTVGGICLMDELYRDVNSESQGSPYLSSYEMASVTRYLQSWYQINGIVNTINTACSSSANAIMYGARLIQNGFSKRVIAGGVDSLSKFTINGFNSLHLLSAEICTPFDENRNGLNLGEGAAFLVLEREDEINGKNIYAELTGYSNSNDAFHPSSLSPEGNGPYLAMKGALASAGIGNDEIGFINAHGTGTVNNDEAESRAMLRLFEDPPPFASTKSNIGHTLGASGAIEAAYSILNLVHQEIYTGLHFKQPIPETGLRPVTTYKQISLRHTMSNSFGFGGNCTSLIFSKA